MNSKETITKIFKEFIRTTWKTKFFFVVIFGFLVAILSFLEPLFFTQIIKVLEVYIKDWTFDITKFVTLIIYWWTFIVISTALVLIYRYFFVIKMTLKNHANLSNKYAKEIINMPFPTYLNKEVGSIYKIFDRGTDSQLELIFIFFFDLIKNIWWITFVICLLFYYDPIMASITLIMLPFMAFLWLFFYKKLYPIQQKLDKEWESVYHDLWNAMSVFSLVKTLSIEKVFSNKMKIKLNTCYNKQVRISKWWTISDMYTWLFTTISRFFVLISGTYFILNWRLDFSTVFLFFSYIWWIYFPIWYLFWRLPYIQKSITASWRFYDEFDNLKNEHKSKKWLRVTLEWNINFDNVNFAYNEKKVINNLSFSVKKWQKIAFVWNTWAGKTTIINLFLKFWKANDWNITIDWININKLNLKNFRKQIWVIWQDSSLFNLSIKENLLFANPKATKSDIKSALIKAEAGFVLNLPNGIETLIWERWLKLSWWEKQRLAIARLFLKNPKILILDEATSALDNKTEKLVQIALEELMKWRTSIIIAHRLSTIMNSDKIFMLENWSVIEKWTYKTLMKNKKDFYNLANPDNLIIS